jgi:predicted ATP-dependent serine protease
LSTSKTRKTNPTTNKLHNNKDLKMSFESINQIQTTVVKRIPTGFDEIDWLYGITQVGNRSAWGLPEGTISLWAGQSGIGKSRLAIELARTLTRKGFRVLYFHNETTKSTFANWVKADGGQMPSNFYVSDATQLSEQLRDIRLSRAKLIIVDSVNMVDDFKYGSDKNIKHIIEGYRQVCQETNCHIILLSQLTKNGKARGSSTLTHLVDSVFIVKEGMNSSHFIFRISDKHRYGRTGDNYWSYWLHMDTHVHCWSDYSIDDKLWCQTHNIKWEDRLAVEKAKIEREQAKETRKFQRNMIMLNLLLGTMKIVAFLIEAFFVGLAGLIIYEGFRSRSRR